MTSIVEASSDAEMLFNLKFTRARTLIECTFGSLKNKLRCLLRHRVLHYTPQKAGLIINACAVLHNIMLGEENPSPTLNAVPLEPVAASTEREIGAAIRGQIVANYFSEVS